MPEAAAQVFAAGATASSAILPSLLSSALLMTKNPAFSAANKAMAELGVAGCIGTACVKQECITPEMVRALSKTIFTVLLPMYIGSSILKTVTNAMSGGVGGVKRSAFFAVPFLAFIQAAILVFISSNLLLPLYGVDPQSESGRSMTVLCSFGNAGVLPFIFADALFRDNAQLLQRALSQVSLFSVGWSPFFWSFGKKLLVGKNDNDEIGGVSKWRKQIKVFMPPPVVGVAVGLVIGLTPFGPMLFSDIDKTNMAPLAVVFNSIQNMGKAASPLALLVLTCSLAMGATHKSAVVTTTGEKQIIVGPIRKWACVSTARFILSPLIMFGLLCGMNQLGVIGTQQSEPMLWFVVLLQSIMPPAQNSVVLLQVANRGDEASEMARFLFSIYATGMIPIVAIITATLDTFHLM